MGDRLACSRLAPPLPPRCPSRDARSVRPRPLPQCRPPPVVPTRAAPSHLAHLFRPVAPPTASTLALPARVSVRPTEPAPPQPRPPPVAPHPPPVCPRVLILFPGAPRAGSPRSFRGCPLSGPAKLVHPNSVSWPERASRPPGRPGACSASGSPQRARRRFPRQREEDLGCALSREVLPHRSSSGSLSHDSFTYSTAHLSGASPWPGCLGPVAGGGGLLRR